MKRKILTLEEVLNLDRCPTLQEMVDLTIEDYAMYLYKKEIIEREPVEDDFDDEDFMYTDDNYNWIEDDLTTINHYTYEPMYDRKESDWPEGGAPINHFKLWDVPDNFNLQKSKEWNNPNIIEKGTIYFRHGCDIEYSIDSNFILTLYEKNTEGKYWNPTIDDDHPLYYLKKYHDKQRASDRKVEA